MPATTISRKKMSKSETTITKDFNEIMQNFRELPSLPSTITRQDWITKEGFFIKFSLYDESQIGFTSYGTTYLGTK